MLIWLAVLCLNASETWHFLPNFQCDIRSVERSIRRDDAFPGPLPPAVQRLLSPDSPLTGAQRRELRWRPAAFPHSDFVRLMPAKGVYGWYACRFDVPAELRGLDALADLGVVDDTDEAFVNGSRVGGLGTVGRPHGTAWRTDRLYRVPARALTPEANVMAVHVWSLWGLGGIVGPPVLKAAVAPAGAQWELAFVKDSARTPDGLNQAMDAEVALAAVACGKTLEWARVPMPWQGFAAWPADVHYAVFRLRFDFRRQDGSPRLPSAPMVMDVGPVFDVVAFYLNGRRVGLTGRFPEGGEPAFTEAAQRGQFAVRPQDWSEDGHNELIAVVHRERGVGGLPGVPGILLSNPLGKGSDRSFADQSALLNVLLQSGRLPDAERVLDAAVPESDAERAWLLSHRAHLAFLKWLDGGGKDDALLDAVLAPVAEILSKCPAEAPRQSAMQALCRVLRLAERDERRLGQVKRHLPRFAGGCVRLPPDRRTQGDWPLFYGNSYFVLAAFGRIADLAGSAEGTQGVVLRTGAADDPARRWQPSGARDTAASDALVMPASQRPAVWQDSARAAEYLKTGRLFPRGNLRRAGWWDDHGEMRPFDDGGPNLHISLKAALRGGQLLSVHLGDFDWRATRHPRQQSLILRDGEGGFRNAAWSGKSDLGVYERFRLASDISLEIACLKHRSACVAVSGIFIDDPVDMSSQTEGATLKRMPGMASAVWKTVMEAERAASAHSAVDGYLAALRLIGDPDELVSLLEALADVRGIHPIWQYAAAGRLRQLSGESGKTGADSSSSHVLRAGSAGGIPVPMQDVLTDLMKRIETEQSSGNK